MPIRKLLVIGGLLFNLIGTVFLFLSVKPSENAFEDNRETGAETPMALIDKNMAKIGIGLIFIGFLFQLISVFMALGD